MTPVPLKDGSMDRTGQSQRVQWGVVALVILLASGLRGTVLFRGPLMPGMNGAYYLVQARSLLSHGALGVPDLPLTFYLQAALSRIVQWVSGWGLDSSILFAVKLADATLPALVALPVFLLVRSWAGSGSAQGWVAPAAAALVTLNAPILSMVGDFEKNSLGLVWLCALLLFIHHWLTRPTSGNAAGVLCFWGLAAVTHIGVFGASVMFGGLALVFCLAMHRGEARRVLWPLAIAAVAVGVIAAGVVLWKFDSHRIEKLGAALSHPSGYLTANNIGMPGGRGGGPQNRMPGFPPGRPPTFLFLPMQSGPSLVFGLTAIAALVTCWRRRTVLPAADVCVVGACAAGVLVLTGPWVQGDKTMRFNLIAIAPAVLAGTFALLHCKHRRLGAALSVIVAAGMVGPSFQLVRQGGRSVVSEEGVRELRSVAPLIADPAKTLIVARHGMEWWTAWTLHTHIAQSPALRTADWQAFKAVYFLRSKGDNNRPMPGGGPPHFGPLSLLSAGFFQPGGPPPPGAGGMPPPPGGPGRGVNPMEEPESPSDAETVHDGERFILSRITSPPAFVLEQTALEK